MPKWRRERALLLDKHFRLLAPRLSDKLCKLSAGLDNIVIALDGQTVGGKALKLTQATLRRAWKRWIAGGKTPIALDHEYKSGASHVSNDLIRELQRRSTQPGCKEHSVAIDSLIQDWKAGKELPGIGTWQDLWMSSKRTRHLPLPDEAPDFYSIVASRTTLYRYAPDAPTKTAGNLGRSKAKNLLPCVRLNYTRLRKGELYTLDDVRLDLVVIDDATGHVTTITCYILMEVGSRYIAGYVAKPSESIKAEDVDELLAYGLNTLGVGDGYVTHILFERGTIACSEAAQLVIEGMTEGEIKIHRTGMVGGVQWVGNPSERRTGNSSAKGCIEAFNHQLHLLLKALPGQRGNHYDTQPSTLGFTGARNKDGSHQTHKGSLVEQSERLAQFEIKSGRRLKLNLGMLYWHELDVLLRQAIKRHNTEPGHNYSGHGQRRERETAPGVWERLNPVIEL